MPVIDYPVDWEPRWYQKPLWDYLNAGGRHAECIWHRRAGKDDVALRHAGCEMLEKPGSYWHMLPQANQVRKAIWDAVNPHSGKRRIDEAFPPELFEKREGDMFIRSRVNASTWQCLGSDNYDGAVGSPPRGIVYSEWALANPSVRGFLRPIITENQGWQIFITTPRGKNHAYQTYEAAKKNPNAFTELLTCYDTNVLSVQQLQEELHEYVTTYGEDMGLALYMQEYECSFDAAIMGAYYAAEFRNIDRDGRVTTVPVDHRYPVHVAMDLGRSDDTSMWFFQSFGGRLRVVKHYATHGRKPEHYIGVIAGRDCQVNIIRDNVVVEWGSPNEHEHDWKIGSIWLPHDGAAATFSTLKTAEEQFAAAFGWKGVNIVPRLSVQDGIQATRLALSITEFDEGCEDGIMSLRAYHRAWDDDKKIFKERPEHDWASHDADGFRYVAVVWNQDLLPKDAQPIRWATDRSFNELLELSRKKRVAETQRR